MSELLQAKKYQSLTLTSGTVITDGPFTFVSQGPGGMYPRFVGPSGDPIFLHAVAIAHVRKRGGVAQ